MRILMTFSHFPVSIPRYFLEAFRRDGHTVWTAGTPFGAWTPWTAEGAQREGMFLPEKYALEPTVALPAGESVAWADVVEQLPLRPDLILHHPTPPSKYGANIVGRPHGSITYAMLLTDPHVLEWYYQRVRFDADYVFNMQDCYRAQSDYYIPYAYAPWHHYLERSAPNRDLDAVCLGLQYPNRKLVMGKLESLGYNVISRVGEAFDEYRALHNRAKIAFSWSSLNDTIARVFEAPQMGCALVTNRTPDLSKFFLDEEVTTFLGDSTDDAVLVCQTLLADPERLAEVATRGLLATIPHTYSDRAASILHIVNHSVPPTMYNRSYLEYLESLKAERRATS